MPAVTASPYLRGVSEYADVPDDVLGALRPLCLALPDAYEEPAWTGTRWRVRTRTFAHVLAPDGEGGPTTILSFRSPDEERHVLLAQGHPFFLLGWGRDAMGMVLDDATDWTEVRELVTESYCVLAPKKLVAQVDRPGPPD